MSIKPLLRAAKLFLAKRGNIGQKDVNTIAPPKSVSVFTGDTYTHELDAKEEDEIPVLRATEHAPVLEGVFADLFREEGAVPPFCHVLICQASPEVDQPPELHLEFTFHDATDELDKFEEKTQKFDFEMDPPSDSPDDLCYAVFLFVCGSPANIEEIIEDKWGLDLAYQYSWGPTQRVGRSRVVDGDYNHSSVKAQAHWLMIGLTYSF